MRSKIMPFSSYLFHYFRSQIQKKINEIKLNNEKETELEVLPSEQKEKYEIILPKLMEYKFNDLEKVSIVDLKILTKHIFTNDLPYQIAYLDYLGFISAINENYTKSKEDTFKLLAKILNAPQRQIKGNVNVLNPVSKEDKKRYTSHLHTEKVKEHYLNIK
jgi:hypothetical protein